mmetsp:Transcript_19170/g.40278  ORF Transcript_19170/g.40278 Transcript_19170/m.40278 type:complete len:122 (-) Transcript_19170:438-803(-)
MHVHYSRMWKLRVCVITVHHTSAANDISTTGHAFLAIQTPPPHPSRPAIGKVQELLWMIPTMIPKIPRAEAKISTIKILTKRDASWASPIAHAEPAMPTDTPDAIFVNPTESPEENIPYPA